MTESELRAAIEDYQPRPEVLNALTKISVLATVGPSASGKTTLMQALIEHSDGIHHVRDETSRDPRPNEQNGVDFMFRGKQEIIQDIEQGSLVQVAVGPNGDLYCTRLSSFPEGTGVIALVPAAVKKLRQLPLGSFKAAFIVPQSYSKWQIWLNSQAKAGNWTPEKKQARLAEAKTSYEFALSDDSIAFVLNDNVAAAAGRLAQVARGQAPDNEDEARRVAEANYKSLINNI